MLRSVPDEIRLARVSISTPFGSTCGDGASSTRVRPLSYDISGFACDDRIRGNIARYKRPGDEGARSAVISYP